MHLKKKEHSEKNIHPSDDIRLIDQVTDQFKKGTQRKNVTTQHRFITSMTIPLKFSA